MFTLGLWEESQLKNSGIRATGIESIPLLGGDTKNISTLKEGCVCSVLKWVATNLDFARQAKISDLQQFVFGNEDITTGKVTVDNAQTGQVLLHRKQQDKEREREDVKWRWECLDNTRTSTHCYLYTGKVDTAQLTYCVYNWHNMQYMERLVFCGGTKG